MSSISHENNVKNKRKKEKNVKKYFWPILNSILFYFISNSLSQKNPSYRQTKSMKTRNLFS